MFSLVKLGNNIKKYRKRLRLSQNDLSEKLMVSCQSISKWENGLSAPSIDNLCLLSKIFNISVDKIIGNEKNYNKVMIGIDGGGTKTEFVMFNDNWDIIDRMVLGPCNPNSVGVEQSATIIKTGIYGLLSNCSDILGIYIGAAGFSSGENGIKVINILKTEFPGVKIKYSTDSLNVIASTTRKDKCLSIICGTGSVIYIKEKDKYTRLSGWGYLLSKSGSGFDIGRDAVHAALKDREGFGDKTVLTKLVENKIGGPVMNFIHIIYKSDQSYLASFAPYVITGYKMNDTVSIDILNENAKNLANIINYAVKHYDCGEDVVMSGSLFTGNAVFPELVKKYLTETVNIIIPKNPQVFGACVLCAENCDVSLDKSSNFLGQYKKIKDK